MEETIIESTEISQEEEIVEIEEIDEAGEIIDDVGRSASWKQRRVDKGLGNSICQSTQVLECVVDIKVT